MVGGLGNGKDKMMVEYAENVRKPAKLGGLGECPLKKTFKTNSLVFLAVKMSEGTLLVLSTISPLSIIHNLSVV